MRSLSLRSRLSWLITVVLLTILVLNAAILVGHAGPRVRAEVNSIERLARELVETALASLQESKDPLPSLHRLFETLKNLRHIDIQILPSDDPSPLIIARSRSEQEKGIPDWFVSFAAPPPKVTIIPATINAVQYGFIAIAPNPVDELAEVWSDVVSLASISLAATMLILAAIVALVRRSLSPFDNLAQGLAQLEAGKANVRLKLKGAAEFREISARLNSLAETLDRVREENLALMKRLIKVQDDERRQIARDLHDEAGPCLFSIRAAASTLLRDTSYPGFDLDRIRNTCREVNAAGKALQDLIRRMLDQLRPPGLSELGLEAAARGLIANWQEARPDVALVLETPHHLDSVSGAVGLTAYRVIQESLTNIYRHASASKARVRLEFENAPMEEGYGHSDAVSSVLRITVEDNGIGISGHRGKGSGLAGMNERVQALKGCISVTDRPGGGTCINVILPLPDEDGKEA